PQLGQTATSKRLATIKGLPPNLIKMPPTCAFLPRCKYHLEKCRQEVAPELRKVGDQHFIACYADIQEKR
ncbi:MAG TPA: oligopeptide/dipeptide ABC transporter ATP-binding protein, partial [Dehalococcoidales bacterium]|nr:oligopeptide/dipeptide ABC transporter ATP-binding protein [Dehalococcoidales bacterium]